MTNAAARLRVTWLATAWLLVAAVVYLSLTPRPVELPLEQGDKLGHLLAYGTTMFWFAQAYEGRRRIAVVLGLVALGVGIEFVQRWTGYRDFDVFDMVADALGVVIGLALAPPRLPNVLVLIDRMLRRHPARRS